MMISNLFNASHVSPSCLCMRKETDARLPVMDGTSLYVRYLVSGRSFCLVFELHSTLFLNLYLSVVLFAQDCIILGKTVCML